MDLFILVAVAGLEYGAEMDLFIVVAIGTL